MLIARPGEKQAWETVYYTHRIVRLGEGLHHSGRLSDAGMQRALKAMGEFAAIIREHGLALENTHAVATAAMREASNGEDFRQRLLAATDINVRIIDGDSEATMSLAGASAVLHPQTRSDMLLFDIGGGSTEFVRAKHGTLQDAISRKLGVVRLVEAHLHSDPPSPEDYQAMIATAHEHLAEVESHWMAGRGDGRIPAHLVGTAGTVTTLAAVHLDLFPYDVEKINNHVISLDEFCQLRDQLLGMTLSKRQEIRTIEQGRADLLIAGLAIIEAVYHRWSYNEMYVVDAGLLEGAWLAADTGAV
ncbi:MAG: Ppx/GppA family phosphatase [Mariprofundaceae bacterium]|nr:Ppx/GppA family phosphatase [Mariprofundaceae bacterium]